MPTYDYKCNDCEISFEELLLSRDEINQYKDSHPCPSCKNLSPRNYVTAFGFAFKGSVRGTSGVHGNSGVHDLDYPTLDKAVARSSEKKWDVIRERQDAINLVRRESNQNAVTLEASGKASATTSSDISNRDSAIKAFKKTLSNE